MKNSLVLLLFAFALLQTVPAAPEADPHAWIQFDRYDKIPQWLGGGQWGSDGSGHVINGDLERWFDRDKLEAYYENQRVPLNQKGYKVGGDGWFSQEK